MTKNDIKQCFLELSRFDIRQDEFERLENRLRTLSLEYHKSHSLKQVEMDERRKQAFQVKMIMNRDFRQLLSRLDQLHQQRSIDNMEAQVLRAKTKLKEFSGSLDREKECFEVIRNQQASYEKVLKEKVNYEVVKATTGMQDELSMKLFAAMKLQIM